MLNCIYFFQSKQLMLKNSLGIALLEIIKVGVFYSLKLPSTDFLKIEERAHYGLWSPCICDQKQKATDKTTLFSGQITRSDWSVYVKEFWYHCQIIAELNEQKYGHLPCMNIFFYIMTSQNLLWVDLWLNFEAFNLTLNAIAKNHTNVVS